MVIVYLINGDIAALSLTQGDAATRYPGERVGGRNPQFYDAETAAPVRNATAVYVRERWGNIIDEYRGFGIPVHIIERLSDQPAAEVAPAVTATEGVAPAGVAIEESSPPSSVVEIAERRGPGRPRKVVNG